MWGSVMKKLHEDLPAKQFFSSDKVVCKPYCAATGLVAKTGCPVSDYGWYKTSNAKYCTSHGGEKITGTSEKQAKEYIAGLKTDKEEKPESSSSSSSSSNTSSGSTSSGSSSATDSTSSATTSSATSSQNEPTD